MPSEGWGGLASTLPPCPQRRGERWLVKSCLLKQAVSTYLPEETVLTCYNSSQVVPNLRQQLYLDCTAPGINAAIDTHLRQFTAVV